MMAVCLIIFNNPINNRKAKSSRHGGHLHFNFQHPINIRRARRSEHSGHLPYHFQHPINIRQAKGWKHGGHRPFALSFSRLLAFMATNPVQLFCNYILCYSLSSIIILYFYLVFLSYIFFSCFYH